LRAASIAGAAFFLKMKTQQVIDFIVQWLADYSHSSRTEGFVVGVSGGIDSAVTSTLCAMTGKTVWMLEMPIHQPAVQVSRAQEHIARLRGRFPNTRDTRVDLTSTFETLKTALPADADSDTRFLALANSRARLRMTTLYYFAGMHRLLVAGTGNKIEDFGVGFYTKYGDGGVDLSPIADLTKSQVYRLAAVLDVPQSIQQAKPTDGLWSDDRSDEDHLGASYPELEWAMEFTEAHQEELSRGLDYVLRSFPDISERDREVLSIYLRLNSTNQHKMLPIPVCTLPKDLL
jgi:NAD+ synthase